MATMHPAAVVANTSLALARLEAAGPFPPELQPFLGFIKRSRCGITQ
jgi:hypothetical protein